MVVSASTPGSLVRGAWLTPLIAGSAVHGQLWFEESAGEALIDATNTPGPNYLFGTAHMIAGGTAGDFDNDGWQDLFIINGGEGPDWLYINNGDGTFTDRAMDWGLTDLHMGAGAAVGDYNGDGWLDLFVTSFGDAGGPMVNGAHRLYRNNGDGTFTDVASEAGVAASDSVRNAFGAAFGDYDLDGDLDLFVTGWFTDGTGGNRLFRNEGDETFTDVTEAAGVLDLDVHGFSVRFTDMNDDRYPELLLVGDFFTSRYYVNKGNGTFADHTATAGVNLDCNGMGSTTGDVDNDGLIDWYVTNIHKDVGDPCGNRLYMNQGDDTFAEVGAAAGVLEGYWGWGTVAVDIDHDGWLDLVEVNGYFDNPGYNLYENKPARLWVNDTDGTFTEISALCNFLHFGQGRGLIDVDFDNDGDRDLAVFSAPGLEHEGTEPFRLFRNDHVTSNHWLRIFLDTSLNPRLAPNGFGTRVVAKVTAGGEFLRYLDGGANYMSQSELSVHIGLGAADQVSELCVLWADGRQTSLIDVAVDQTMTITAPPMAGDLNVDLTVNMLDLLAMLEQWGPCDGCPADIDGDGVVNAADLLRLLANWG